MRSRHSRFPACEKACWVVESLAIDIRGLGRDCRHSRQIQGEVCRLKAEIVRHGERVVIALQGSRIGNASVSHFNGS